MLCHICGHEISRYQLGATFNGTRTVWDEKDIYMYCTLFICSECNAKITEHINKDEDIGEVVN